MSLIPIRGFVHLRCFMWLLDTGNLIIATDHESNDSPPNGLDDDDDALTPPRSVDTLTDSEVQVTLFAEEKKVDNRIHEVGGWRRQKEAKEKETGMEKRMISCFFLSLPLLLHKLDEKSKRDEAVAFATQCWCGASEDYLKRRKRRRRRRREKGWKGRGWDKKGE